MKINILYYRQVLRNASCDVKMAVACVSVASETAVQLSFENLSTGFLCMRDKQKEAVLAVLCGKNFFVRLPLDTARPLSPPSFPEPSIARGKKRGIFMVLCICPLIFLMIEQRRQLRMMG